MSKGIMNDLFESYSNKINGESEMTLETALDLLEGAYDGSTFLSPKAKDKIFKFFRPKKHDSKIEAAIKLYNELKNSNREFKKDPLIIAAEVADVDPRVLRDYMDKQVKEKAPPGMEDWITDRKEDFKERYGDKWEEVLYATAWKRYNATESLEERITSPSTSSEDSFMYDIKNMSRGRKLNVDVTFNKDGSVTYQILDIG